MAEGQVSIYAAALSEIVAKVDTKLVELGYRMVATARSEAPVSQGRSRGPRREGPYASEEQFKSLLLRQRRRSGRQYEFKVFVELGDDGRPQIVKGGRTNAAASRAIKTKQVSDLTPVKGNVGLFTYTFKRQHGGLKKSIQLVHVGPGKIRIVANIRYAWFVHEGKGPGRRSRNPFLTRTLDHHMSEFQSGDFLKR